MSTELTNVTPWEVISREIDKGTPVGDLTELFNLQERYEKQEAAKKFAASVTRFQQIAPPVPKTKPVRNKSGAIIYHFADYADLLGLIQPYLTECEIVPTFDFQKKDGQHVAVCRIRVGTHVEETSVPTSIPDILNTNEAQRLGGMTTYGKRCSLIAALNIRVIGEDTDATDQDEVLSKEEVGLLANMIDELNFMRDRPLPVDRMVNWLRPGGSRLEEIPSSQFVNAVQHLREKMAEAEKAAEAKKAAEEAEAAAKKGSKK